MSVAKALRNGYDYCTCKCDDQSMLETQRVYATLWIGSRTTSDFLHFVSDGEFPLCEVDRFERGRIWYFDVWKSLNSFNGSDLQAAGTPWSNLHSNTTLGCACEFACFFNLMQLHALALATLQGQTGEKYDNEDAAGYHNSGYLQCIRLRKTTR